MTKSARPVGFCHGVTYKFLDKNSSENINLFKNCGSTAIEINCHFAKEVEQMNGLAPLVAGFAYRSIHLPCDIRYKDDEATNAVLLKIEKLYRETGAKLAVVHPDLVDDFSVFDEYPSITWAIENMDDRKASYRSVAEVKNFLDDHPNWGLVLDVGHCNANDKSMKLADDFIAALKPRIKEIHLSGYEHFHDPLHRTRQTEIIDRCRKLNVPIIIESVFEATDGAAGIAKELNYILENLTPKILS
jgi:hypothetical protein